MNKRTPETAAHDAYSKLCALQNNDDLEMAHIEADEILCNLIKELGYPLVAEAFNKIHKWYA